MSCARPSQGVFKVGQLLWGGKRSGWSHPSRFLPSSCVHISVYMCMHTLIHTPTHLYSYTHLDTYVHSHVYSHTGSMFTCVHTCSHMHTHPHACTPLCSPSPHTGSPSHTHTLIPLPCELVLCSSEPQDGSENKML